MGASDLKDKISEIISGITEIVTTDKLLKIRDKLEELKAAVDKLDEAKAIDAKAADAKANTDTDTDDEKPATPPAAAEPDATPAAQDTTMAITVKKTGKAAKSPPAAPDDKDAAIKSVHESLAKIEDKIGELLKSSKAT